MAHHQSDNEPAPYFWTDDAFELFGNDTRLKILRALWESPNEPVTFSELRNRAGNPDSGQFNYHLKKLLGTFIQKTDDGYKPLHTGKQVITAILAATNGGDSQIDAFAIDGACPFCEGELEASYQNEEATIRCRACGKIQMLEEVPPTAFAERTSTEAVQALDRWMLGRTLLMTEGVCPNCAGTINTSIFDTRSPRDANHEYVRVRHRCRTCTYECDVPIWLYVLLVNHPAVISFYYDHGVDVTTLSGWERTAYGTDYNVQVHSDDPFCVTVRIPIDGDELHLTMDQDLTINEVRRETTSIP